MNWLSDQSKMVDFGSGQGRSVFANGGVAGYVEDCKKRERRPGPKNAVYDWALIGLWPLPPATAPTSLLSRLRFRLRPCDRLFFQAAVSGK